MRASAGRALVAEALPVMGLATAGLAVVGLLVVLGQALAAAAVAPAPAGVLRLALGLSPVVLGIALPVGLLFGLVAAARSWREGGDWLALAASGGPARAAAGPVLVVGIVGGLAVALLSHGLEPLGRREAWRTLAVAAGDLRLQPGRPVVVGEALVLAGDVAGRELTDVRLAVGDAAVAARAGMLRGGGQVALEDGQARSLEVGGARPWTLDFARAELRLDVMAPRVELADRTDAELRALVARQEAEGRDATAARLALARRSALPLALPLLALLALPLGARGLNPGPATVATVLAWWAVLRVSDQLAPAWGPAAAAAAPIVALALGCGVAWGSWREGGLWPGRGPRGAP
ncbi:LptF/LptG family permease [Myxococcota bacterium]|nr:LptF/LptG family permease [Myxococcota bacterium]